MSLPQESIKGTKKSRRKQDGQSSKDHLSRKSDHEPEGGVDGGLAGIAETDAFDEAEESLIVKPERGEDASKETLSVDLTPGNRRRTIDEPLVVPVHYRDLDGSPEQDKVMRVYVSALT